MNLKLEEMTQDIVVVSSTAEEWATVQNIFKGGNYEIIMPEKGGDSFDKTPNTSIWSCDLKRFIDLSNDPALIGDKNFSFVPACDFIAANTLANLTTNLNNPTQESMNA